MPYIPKGARWVCENGHVIATFNQDIYLGDLLKPEHLDWVGPTPFAGTLVTHYECPTCGAPPAFDHGIGFVRPHTVPPE